MLADYYKTHEATETFLYMATDGKGMAVQQLFHMLFSLRLVNGVLRSFQRSTGMREFVCCSNTLSGGIVAS